jgi:hypothetical protein
MSFDVGIYVVVSKGDDEHRTVAKRGMGAPKEHRQTPTARQTICMKALRIERGRLEIEGELCDNTP